MRAKELIAKLQEIIDEEGDEEVRLYIEFAEEERIDTVEYDGMYIWIDAK